MVARAGAGQACGLHGGGAVDLGLGVGAPAFGPGLERADERKRGNGGTVGLSHLELRPPRAHRCVVATSEHLRPHHGRCQLGRIYGQLPQRHPASVAKIGDMGLPPPPVGPRATLRR